MVENYAAAKKLETIIVSCILAFVVVLVVAIVSIVAVGKAKRQVASYNKLITELSAEESNLKNGIAVNQTDAYLEQQAREHLGMLKEGETIYYFD